MDDEELHLPTSKLEERRSNQLDEPRSTQEKELDQAYLKFLLKQVAMNRRYARLNEFFTYDAAKENVKWFLDSATLNVSFTVKDVYLTPYHIFSMFTLL